MTGPLSRDDKFILLKPILYQHQPNTKGFTYSWNRDLGSSLHPTSSSVIAGGIHGVPGVGRAVSRLVRGSGQKLFTDQLRISLITFTFISFNSFLFSDSIHRAIPCFDWLVSTYFYLKGKKAYDWLHDCKMNVFFKSNK